MNHEMEVNDMYKGSWAQLPFFDLKIPEYIVQCNNSCSGMTLAEKFFLLSKYLNLISNK